MQKPHTNSVYAISGESGSGTAFQKGIACLGGDTPELAPDRDFADKQSKEYRRNTEIIHSVSSFELIEEIQKRAMQKDLKVKFFFRSPPQGKSPITDSSGKK
jgi:hypothetical protein